MTVETPPGVVQSGSISAELDRRRVTALLQRGSTIGSIVGGLIAPTDMAVTAGSGMQVLVAPGEAFVPGTSSATQGGYYSRVSSSTALTIAAANVTNPRVDLVVAQVEDAAYSGASNLFQVAVLTGTATSGATLSNLSGAPSLTASSLALAYVLVPANATSISSILAKAVPAIGAGGVTFSQPTRVLGTIYQPNATRSTFVTVAAFPSDAAGAEMAVNIGPTSTPTTQVARVFNNSSADAFIYPISFIVPPGWFYEFVNVFSNTVVIEETSEWTL